MIMRRTKCINFCIVLLALYALGCTNSKGAEQVKSVPIFTVDYGQELAPLTEPPKDISKAVDVHHLMKMALYGISGDKSRLGSHITIGWFYDLQEDERADAR